MSGYRRNPVGGHPHSEFELLGNSKNPDKIKQRYATALSICRQDTIDMFTSYQGFDLRRFNEWSPAMRSQVRRYYNEIMRLRTHGSRARVKGPRSEKRLKEAQKISQHTKFIGKIKPVYIPSTTSIPSHIEFTKTGVAYRRDKFFDVFSYYFEHKYLFSDDDDLVARECHRAWNSLMKAGANRKFEFMTLITGDSESFSFSKKILSADDLLEAIKRLIFDEQSGRDWREWLRGVNAYFRHPGSKKTISIGTLKTQRMLTRDEKKAARRKARSASTETKQMLKRRATREQTIALELSHLYKRLDDVNALKEEMRLVGAAEAPFNKIISKLKEEIRDLELKVTERYRFNKRRK